MKHHSTRRARPRLEALEERCAPSAVSHFHAHPAHGALWQAGTQAL